MIRGLCHGNQSRCIVSDVISLKNAHILKPIRIEQRDVLAATSLSDAKLKAQLSFYKMAETMFTTPQGEVSLLTNVIYKNSPECEALMAPVGHSDEN